MMEVNMKSLIFPMIVLLISACTPFLFGNGQKSKDLPDPPIEKKGNPVDSRIAIFAGGCFWGIEAVYERLEGVLDAASGYSGGKEETATYDMVSSGRTDHAESVLITYDPERISYGTLLKVFFSVAHNPTQLNYQGPDHGRQYRSAIFYVDDEQKRIAEEYIKSLEDANVFSKPIVTEVIPFTAFYPAEEYHQDFMARNPRHPYIVQCDVPKVEHLEREYPELLIEE